MFKRFQPYQSTFSSDQRGGAMVQRDPAQVDVVVRLLARGERHRTSHDGEVGGGIRADDLCVDRVAVREADADPVAFAGAGHDLDPRPVSRTARRIHGVERNAVAGCVPAIDANV